ncbi:MAG: right-handed parallel beta-helix repeat-containing protein [Planctomycetota bacterium]|nr:right-handed parallel beta-helix repeat-containing protein [Planctomycetota bacterium]
MNLSAISNSMQSGDSSVFAGYQILGEISRGGMGVVYRVLHSELDREMALKVILRPDGDPSLTVRFKREARALGQLRHPNILNVSDFGYENEMPYLVTDYIKGQDLESLFSKAFRECGKIDLNWLLPKLKDLAEALSHCHEKGITHRDLKPANILIENETERLVLIDFGLVKEEGKAGAGHLADLSLSGEMIGTPEYMSPEQFDAGGEFGRPGPASDVWGFGVLLYYCLSGEKPFRGDTIYNYFVAIFKNDPLPLKILNEDCPRQLSDLVKDCLRKDPGDRPTMDEVGEILADSLQRGHEDLSHNSVKWLVAAVVVILLLIVGVFLLNRDVVAPGIVWDDRPKRLIGGEMVLSGGVTEPDCILLFDGKRVAVENWRFHVKVPLTFEGKSFAIELTDSAGNSYIDKIFLKRSGVVRVSKELGDGDFRSLSEALKATPKEVVIELEPGEYIESIVLKEGRSIVSRDRSKTVTWRPAKGYCLLVQGGQSKLQGIRLEASKKGERGIVVKAGHLVLTDCYVSSSKGTGVLVMGKDAKFEAKGSIIVQCGNAGLHIGGMAQAKLLDCKILKSGSRNVDVMSGASIELKNCVITGAKNVGIHLRSSKLKASHCNISENYGVGVRAVSYKFSNSFVDLKDCKVQNNRASPPDQKNNRFRGSGLSFSRGSEVALENCQLSNNDGNGLLLEAGRGVIENCRAYSNALDGFYCYATVDAKFLACKAEGNKKNGFVSSKRGKVSFERCESRENRTDGFRVHDGASGAFRSCEALDNASSGISIVANGGTIVLTDCTARGNKYGVFVLNGSKMNGTRLLAKDNTMYGLFAKGKSEVNLLQSTITSNQTYDLYLLTGSKLIAENSVFEKERPGFLYRDKASKIIIRGN